MPLRGTGMMKTGPEGITKNTFGMVTSRAAQGKQERTVATERENSVASVSFARTVQGDRILKIGVIVRVYEPDRPTRNNNGIGTAWARPVIDTIAQTGKLCQSRPRPPADISAGQQMIVAPTSSQHTPIRWQSCGPRVEDIRPGFLVPQIQLSQGGRQSGAGPQQAARTVAFSWASVRRRARLLEFTLQRAGLRRYDLRTPKRASPTDSVSRPVGVHAPACESEMRLDPAR